MNRSDPPTTATRTEPPSTEGTPAGGSAGPAPKAVPAAPSPVPVEQPSGVDQPPARDADKSPAGRGKPPAGAGKSRSRSGSSRKPAGQRLIGVRAPNSCMIYRLGPAISNIKPDDPVLLQSKEGEVLGRVVFVSSERLDKVPRERLHSGRYTRIIRIANEKDLKFFSTRQEKEQKAKLFCREKIREMKLPMKLSRTSYQPNGKVIFHFTAENRVDFRELVRVLGSHLKTRVEMRHVGVRDETRLLGGLGPCGKTFCCAQYLKKFHPVSVRMAKNQDLSLNPEGISGICGRLLCCLAYENEVYQDRRANLPKPKSHLWTKDGREGTVRSLQTLAETVEMQFGDGSREQFSACDLCQSKPEPEQVSAQMTDAETPFPPFKTGPGEEMAVPPAESGAREGKEGKAGKENKEADSRKKESGGRSRSRRGGRKRDRTRPGKGREGERTADGDAVKGKENGAGSGEKKGRSQRGKKQRQAGGKRGIDPQQSPAETTVREDGKTGETATGEAPTGKSRRRRRRRRSRGGQREGQVKSAGGGDRSAGGTPPVPGGGGGPDAS